MAETEPGGGARQRLAAPRDDRFGAALFALSETLAVFGGIVLIVMTAFTVVSVVGRTGFDLPVLGDQEIVELGCAIAIFSFMPYCQMRAANVIVDFFTARLSQAARDGLDATMNAIFSVCILIVTWRLAVGGIATPPRPPTHRCSCASRNGGATRSPSSAASPGRSPASIRCCARSGTCGNPAARPGPPHERLRDGAGAVRGDASGDHAAHARRARHAVHRRAGLCAPGRLGSADQDPQQLDLQPVLVLHPVGGAAVPADGAVRDQGRAQPGPVPRRQRLVRLYAGRAGDRLGGGLRDVRRDLRLVARHRGDHVPGGAARNAPLPLLGRAVDRHAGGRRDAGHPDPALGDPGHLRRLYRAVDRPSVPRRPDPGDHRDHRLHDRGRGLCPPVPGSRARGAARLVAREADEPAGNLADGAGLRAGGRRHLSRLVLAHRRRGDRRGGGRAARRHRGQACAGGACASAWSTRRRPRR